MLVVALEIMLNESKLVYNTESIHFVFKFCLFKINI